jgi:pentatricopeptide repeat protein
MPPQREELTDDSLIDISHESVIRQWARLKDWVLDEHKIAQIRKVVGEKAVRWKEEAEDKDYLLFGVELAEAKAWRAKYPTQLGADEGRLLAESIRHEQEEVRRDEAVKYSKQLEVKNRWLWTWLVIALFFGILATIFAWKARENEQEAEGHQRDAEDHEKAGQHKIARMFEERGSRSIEEGDLSSSHLWFIRALEYDKHADLSAEAENIHRIRIGTTLRQHPQLVQLVLHKDLTSAVLSSDGRWILTTGQDGKARVWDATTGKQSHTFRVDANGLHVRINWAAFSPEGSLVATGRGTPGSDSGGVQLWKVATEEKVWSHPCGGAVNYVAFSPDGRRVLATVEAHGGDRGEVRIWQVDTGKELFPRLTHDKGVVNHAAFSPDGQYLATASGQSRGTEGEAQVWDLAARGRLFTLRTTGPVNHVEFSLDGSRIVTAEDERRGEAGRARLWNAQSGSLIRVLTVHQGSVKWASFSPDGRLVVTASEDSTAHVLDARTGRVLHTLKHGSTVFSAIFSPDGRYVATASRDRSARVWEADTGQPITPPLHDTGSVTQAVFSADGYRVLAASAHTARLWQLTTGNPLPRVLDARGWVQKVACSSDGRFVLTLSGQSREQAAGDHLNEAAVWETKNGRLRAGPLRHEGPLSCAALSPDGRYVATASDAGKGKTAEVKIWDAATGTPLLSRLEKNPVVYATVFSGNGQYLLTASAEQDGTRQTLELWEVPTGKKLHSLTGENDPINCADFSPDNRWIATGTGKLTNDTGRAQIWDIETGKKCEKVMEHQPGEGGVLHVAFSPDSRRLVTASADDSAKVWEIRPDGQVVEQATFEHTADVTYAAFGPGSDSLVTVSKDPMVVVWDVESHARRATFPHESYPNYAAFSPNGRLVVTASHDGTARLWDVSGSHLVTVLRHGGELRYAAFPKDNQIVTVGYRLGTQPREEGNSQPSSPPRAGSRAAPRTPQAPSSEALARQVQTRVWELAPSESSIEILYNEGRLLAAQDLKTENDSEILWPIEKEEELFNYWKETKQLLDYPTESGDIHDRDVVECEATSQWFAAAWHLTRVIEAKSGEAIGGEHEKALLYARRAEAYAHLGAWGKAYDDYSKALRLDPADSEKKWGAKCEDLEKNHKLTRDKIEEMKLTQALSKNHNDKEARHNRAQLYLRLKQWEKSAQDYSVLIDLGQGDWNNWFGRAKAYYHLVQWNKVLDDCSEALKRERKEAELWALRANARGALQEWDGALSDYRQALGLNPYNGNYLLGRARTYVGQGMAQEAVRDYVEAVQQFAEQSQPDLYSVDIAYAEALELQPNNVLLLRQRAKAHPFIFGTNTFVSDYTKALKLQPGNPQLLRDRADAYVRGGRWSEAAEDYTVAMQAGQKVRLQALGASTVGLLNAPAGQGPYLALQLFLSSQSDEHTLWKNRGRAYMSQQQWNLAVKDFTEALRLLPGDGELWHWRAEAYDNWPKWGEALSDYTEALKSSPKNWQLLQNRGAVYAKMGKWSEAAADYRAASQMQPAFYPLQQNHVNALVKLGRWQDAIKVYDEMINGHMAYNVDVWIGKAQAQAELGRWEEAAATLKSAAEFLTTQNRNMWRPQALVILKKGDSEAYRQLCIRILNRFGQTDQADLANTVALVCLVAPGAVSDPDRLVQLAMRAIANAPSGNYAYTNTLGVALYRAGRFEEAVTTLTKACEIYTDQGIPRATLPDGRGTALDGLVLAMAHHKLGSSAEAQRRLAQSVLAIDQFARQKLRDAGDRQLTWNRIELDLFRREAEAVLKSKD